MKFTNSLVQIACNKMLSIHGGDLYVGVMTVINAIRDVLPCPPAASPTARALCSATTTARGRCSASGRGFASCPPRRWSTRSARGCLRCSSRGCSAGFFTPDEAMVEASVRMLRVYFAGFFFQSFQFCGQSVFSVTGLGEICHYVFPAAQGGHRCAADAAAARRRAGHDRRVPRRADFQHRRRLGLLYHHAVHGL